MQFLERVKQPFTEFFDKKIKKKKYENIRKYSAEAQKEVYNTAMPEIKKYFKKFFIEMIIKVILLLLPLLFFWLHLIDKSIVEYLIAGVYLFIVINFIRVAIVNTEYIKQFIFEYNMNPKAFATAFLHSEIVKKVREKEKASRKEETLKEKIGFYFSSLTKKSVTESAIEPIAHIASRISTKRIFMAMPLLLVKPVVSFIVYIAIFEFVIAPFITGDSSGLYTLNIAQLAILPITMSIDKVFGSTLSQLIIS